MINVSLPYPTKLYDVRDQTEVRRQLAAAIQLFNTALAQVTSSSGGGGGSTAWADITGKPSTFPPDAHTHPTSDIISGTMDGARLALTTKGDIVGFDGSGAVDRLPVGSNGQVLAASSGATLGIAWITAGGGGGDAYLANNQTFTGINTFSNTSGIWLGTSTNSILRQVSTALDYIHLRGPDVNNPAGIYVGSRADPAIYMDADNIYLRPRDGSYTNVVITNAEVRPNSDGTSMKLGTKDYRWNSIFCGHGYFTSFGSDPSSGKYLRVRHDNNNGYVESYDFGGAAYTDLWIRAGAVLPRADVVSDFGSSSKRWLAGFFGSHMVIGTGGIITGAGLTAGHVLKASSSTAFAFAQATVQKVINFVIDGGGIAITTGSKGYLTVPAGTVTGWQIMGDVSGSIVVDVKRSTYSGFPTTSSIAGSEKPTLSSAQKNQDLALSSWTTSLAAGDILEFNVDSITTCTRVTVSIFLASAVE